jgi:Ca-activated chloride channel family protein
LAETPAAAQPDPVAGLVDIPLPAPVSLWPQTWESRVIIALLLAGLVAGGWWLVHRWHANRYRRAALAELERIESAAAETEPSDIASALASLVPLNALAAFPREQVASLAGPAWLAFLDRTGGGRDFAGGPGQSLEIAAYRPAPEDTRALFGVVRHWIKAHHD